MDTPSRTRYSVYPFLRVTILLPAPGSRDYRSGECETSRFDTSVTQVESRHGRRSTDVRTVVSNKKDSEIPGTCLVYVLRVHLVLPLYI